MKKYVFISIVILLNGCAWKSPNVGDGSVCTKWVAGACVDRKTVFKCRLEMPLFFNDRIVGVYDTQQEANEACQKIGGG